MVTLHRNFIQGCILTIYHTGLSHLFANGSVTTHSIREQVIVHNVYS